jgi:cytidylate kinase
MFNLNSRAVLPVLAALHVTEHEQLHGAPPQTPRPPTPFITISRQAGASGRSVAAQVVKRLNDRDPDSPRWTVWDDELVERVAHDDHLPGAKVAALEDVRPSWLEEALGSLVVSEPPVDEMKVYARVSATIRGLVAKGHVVIVGRGAVFVTDGIAGGIHVRLVAPIEQRIEWTVRARNLSREAAAEWVRETDAARKDFYHRHFPGRPFVPESFHATYNTAVSTVEQIAESVLALVPREVPVVHGMPAARR